MDNEIDIKRLKKLADACRKAGIKHFKAEGIEFTLSDYVPEKPTRKRKSSPTLTDSNPIGTNFVTDELTQEQLLAWNDTGNP